MEGQRFPKSRSSLEDIHQQIASLRRENRFLKFGLVFCLIIATLPYLAGFQPATIRAKRLITEKVEFVRDGETVFSIGVHPKSTALVIWGKGVKPLVFLGAGEFGGSVGVYNKNGNFVALMDANEYGGSISVHYKNGIHVALIGANVIGGSVVVLNKNGIPGAIMGADENGGSISVANKNGIPVAAMSATKDGGGIFLTDNKGKPIWGAP